MEENNKWPYIAGFIDCDGSIAIGKVNHTTLKGVSKTYYYPKVCFHSSYEVYLQEIAILLENRAKVIKTVGNGVSRTKVMYRINVQRQQDLIYILENVIPYLILKKDKAIEALEIVKTQRVRSLKRWTWGGGVKNES